MEKRVSANVNAMPTAGPTRRPILVWFFVFACGFFNKSLFPSLYNGCMLQ